MVAGGKKKISSNGHSFSETAVKPETDGVGERGHCSLPVDLEVNNPAGNLRLSQTYSIRGQVVNPLKVSLHRNQFGQILDTMNNLTRGESNVGMYRNPKKISSKDGGIENSAAESVAGAHIPIEGSFSVPRIILQLCPDGGFTENKSALVSFALEDFVVGYSKPKIEESTTEITLGSFVAEDLNLDETSPHRTLASSIGNPIIKMFLFQPEGGAAVNF